MMRVALVVWSLLLGAAPAAANCAWMLWMNNGVTQDQNPWIPSSAYTTQRDCAAGAQTAFNKFKGDGVSVMSEDAAGGVFLITTTTSKRRDGQRRNQMSP
jgi:hypothetical protein